MNLLKILEESIDSLWNNATYGATSELPRKDYQPYTTSSGYSYPYQQGIPPTATPGDEKTEEAAVTPWPLHTIETDLSNSFIHLVTALEKMQECLDKNISITKNQKTKIKNLMKISTNALRRIELVGVNVSKIFKK
jgi:hypothetical protein